MLKAAGDYVGSLPDYDDKVASRLPATVPRLPRADDAINRQKRALIDGAYLPHRWHDELNLKSLGTVVNKALPVFGPARTVLSLLEIDDC